MNNKLLKIGALILFIPTLYIVMYLLQNHLLSNSLENKWLTAKGTEFKGYEFVRCDYNLIRPQVAFVDDYILLGDIEGLEVHFYTQESLFDFSRNSWSEKNYTGGTDIQNTTFPQLVAMVKEDCEQFQYGYDNPDPDGPRWTYTAYIADEEDVPSEDEKIKERLIIDANMIIKEFLELPQHQQDNVINHYGGYEGKTAQEVIEWFNLVDKEFKEGKFNFDKGML